MSSLLTVPNDDSGILSWLGVVGLKKTWDQKLSSGLLLTFMTVHLFQFCFVDADQYCHSGWLITVTFFWTGYKHVPLAPNCRVLKNPVWCGFTWKKFIVEDGLGSGVVFWTDVAHVHDRTLLPVPLRSY